MSRLCAKPTCSNVAERWFDVIAAQCQVVERHEATPSTIALCGSHAARFSPPHGWTWIRLGEGSDPAALLDPRPDESDSETTSPDVVESAETIASSSSSSAQSRRKHTRDAPWFLANATASEPQDDNETIPEESGAEVSNEFESSEAPSAGSLLHRAFHGPDRELDSARALEVDRERSASREPRTQSTGDAGDDDGDVAPVRDLTSRRNARSTVTSYDVELPFPPLDAESHVAVS